jgi:hypothetical protein
VLKPIVFITTQSAYIALPSLRTPETFKQKNRKIRLITIDDDYSTQSPATGHIPNPALQLRFVTPKSELGKNHFYLFPCPIFSPAGTRFYHKLLNGFWFSILVDAQNGELFRCRGLFKTRNNLHHEVRGDLYIF